MHHEDERMQLAITDLLAKLGNYWSPAPQLETRHPLRPVRDIVHGAQLSAVDVAYLQAEAPSVLVQTTDSEVYVDYSVMTEARTIHLNSGSTELNIHALRAWHLILLRSTFWPRYHEVYEQVGSLIEINRHADVLWNMVDPLSETQDQPLATPDAAVRSTVVFRQILATRSELSDLHPIDALARFCVPGYYERLHDYVQQHAVGISQMLGLTV